MLASSARSTHGSQRLFWRIPWLGHGSPGMRLGALCVLFAFCTLLVVSGPHLVHHATELPLPDAPHPYDDQSAHNDHPSQDAPNPTAPDCHVLFFVRHTPVAASGGLPVLALLHATEPVLALSRQWVSATPPALYQARAPPASLL